MTDIAIVGIGARFGGGIGSPEAFWDFVLRRRDAVVDVPSTRWDYRRFYDPDPRVPGRAYTKRGAFLTGDPWVFDPEFFGISVREARSLDPQQRLLMEVGWEALDDAGIAGRVSGEPVGVYVGAFTLDHMATLGMDRVSMDMHSAVSASNTMLSNRLAYTLNLTGPALTVDTACSSSLVAFHLACRAISDDDCDLALVGGVNVMLRPEMFVTMCKGGFLAPDGRCKSFDAAADGYGRGEGAGVLVLERLEDAVRHRDRVYAVVKGTGSNQDGRTTAITVPNALAQEKLARTVCHRARLVPSSIAYVEAHGTGTPVGDPLELSALGRVYGTGSGRPRSLGVGSVKATLGHTEAAAGVASLIKACLAIRKRMLPPQGWIDRPNPDIPFAELGLHLQSEAVPFEGDAPMVVAVNGFGYGGTNAHVVLQEYREAEAVARPVSVTYHDGVYPLSARTPVSVRELAARTAASLKAGMNADRLADAAWARMFHHPHRTGISFADPAELIRELDSYSAGDGRDAPRVVISAVTEPVFVFSGMGPQWWAMGRELLCASTAFAEAAGMVDRAFRQVSGWSVIEELLRPEDESRVTTTQVAQPATFLIQVGICAELATRGVRPAAVVGHSVGEVAAGYIAGVLSMRDAVQVIYHRARLQAMTAGSGGMLAVGLSLDEVQALAGDSVGVDVAAVNSRTSVTLAGDRGVLERFAVDLHKRGGFARILRVDVPYHSAAMDTILSELHSSLAGITPEMPELPLYSTVTGRQVTEEAWDAGYWCANVRHPVRFGDAIDAIVTVGHRVFVEVGPHPVVSGNIREALMDQGENGVAIATLRRNQGDRKSLHETVIGLYGAGVIGPGEYLGSDVAVEHVPVPRYPWQQMSLPTEQYLGSQELFGVPGGYAMLGVPDPQRRGSWTVEIDAQTFPWITDHVVDGLHILPATAYLDAALSAAAVHLGTTSAALENVRFVAPLIMATPDVPVVKLDVEESNGRFIVYSRGAAGASWTVHATGRIVAGVFDPATRVVPAVDDTGVVSTDDFYARLAERGLQYGPAFAMTTSLRAEADVVVSTVDGSIGCSSSHLAHPVVVDAAMQSVALLFAGSVSDRRVLVPVGVSAVRFYGQFPETVTVVAQRVSESAFRADIDIVDTDGTVCLRLLGVELGSLTPERGPLQRMGEFFYTDEWIPGSDLGDVDATASIATLIVPIDSSAWDSAVRLAEALAAPVVGFADTTDGFGDMVDDSAVLQAATGEALHVHIVAVAASDVAIDDLPSDADDDVTMLWQLRRLAVAVDALIEPEQGRSARWRVTVVTQEAFARAGDRNMPNPRQAAPAGARRVLLNEQPAVNWRLIDIAADTALSMLVAELSAPDESTEDEVYLRGGRRWVPRVTRSLPQRLEVRNTAAPLVDTESNFVLEVPPTHTYADLIWRRTERRAPGPREVEVRMNMVGLAYKDAMKVLGVLGEREMAGTYFGMSPAMEGVGTVVRTGAGVGNVAIGDRVSVGAPGMLRRFHTVAVSEILSMPEGAETGWCTSVMSFSTARYALIELARLQPGETVLIHGAAGGVGTAAAQIAHVIGARVVGTASTECRRDYVLSYGADHVLNSRSLDFVAKVMELTNGRGVDVVVSSAPGEILRHNFAAVAEPGRIVEVGKADIYQDGLLELALFDKNLSYFSIDMDRLVASGAAVYPELMARTYKDFLDGTYRPLPYVTYRPDEVGRAFEDVARSEHLGRIALDLDVPAPPVYMHSPEFTVHPDASYLVTGGFGGVGLATAEWLVNKGARRLVLVGRRGATTSQSQHRLGLWRAAGVEVVQEKVDVTDRAAITEVVRRAHTFAGPLRGIFHSAAVLADNRVTAMTHDELTRVYRTKVDGARALEYAIRTVGVDPDTFVLYSSAATTFGNVGQYNYCAANLVLEVFAEQLVRQGIPALCVGWGHLSGVDGGMTADETVAKALRLAGFDSVAMADAMTYMEQAIGLGVVRAAIVPTDFRRVAGIFPKLVVTGRMAALFTESAVGWSSARLATEWAALDQAERNDRATGLLAEQLAVVMDVSVESIDPAVPVVEQGLDSLMTMEFRARIGHDLGVEFMALQLGHAFTLEQAGVRLAEHVVAAAGAPAQSS